MSSIGICEGGRKQKQFPLWSTLPAPPCHIHLTFHTLFARVYLLLSNLTQLSLLQKHEPSLPQRGANQSLRAVCALPRSGALSHAHFCSGDVLKHKKSLHLLGIQNDESQNQVKWTYHPRPHLSHVGCFLEFHKVVNISDVASCSLVVILILTIHFFSRSITVFYGFCGKKK